MLYPRGSEWRRWDLHIHSPLSILNNQFPHLPDGTPDWELYIKRIEELDVAVVGVTDYFTIDGYRALKDAQAKGRLPGVVLLPNIEFRLDKFVASKKDGEQQRRINFHVLFAEDVKPEEIEEHFLHDIYFNYQGTPGDKNDQRKLKKSNLAELGQRLIKEHDAFKGTSALQVGATNAVVNLDHIAELLTKSARFKDKYLLVLADEYASLIPWDGQDHQTRKMLVQQAHIIFTSNQATAQWALGQPPFEGGPNAFIVEFRSLKPCIHGSDGHSIAEAGHPCSKRALKGHICAPDSPECDPRYTWIKADPGFEGLRQTLYEPADRVYIGPSAPVYYDEARVISSITIAQSGGWFDEVDIPLNPGLVSIIGQKGSGKSALAEIAAYSAGSWITEEPASFIKRAGEHLQDLSVTLNWANGERTEARLWRRTVGRRRSSVSIPKVRGAPVL
jgi:hypothetical protein